MFHSERYNVVLLINCFISRCISKVNSVSLPGARCINALATLSVSSRLHADRLTASYLLVHHNDITLTPTILYPYCFFINFHIHNNTPYLIDIRSKLLQTMPTKSIHPTVAGNNPWIYQRTIMSYDFESYATS